MCMQEKKKIMIVDDSVIMIRLIKKYIEGFNIEVVGTAEDGKMALEVFKKTDPDIVTLDITMPKIDGLLVLEKMLEIKDSTKIIVITALTDKTTGLKAIKLGAKGFLGKPFTEEEIKWSICQLINKN